MSCRKYCMNVNHHEPYHQRIFVYLIRRNIWVGGIEMLVAASTGVNGGTYRCHSRHSQGSRYAHWHASYRRSMRFFMVRYALSSPPLPFLAAFPMHMTLPKSGLNTAFSLYCSIRPIGMMALSQQGTKPALFSSHEHEDAHLFRDIKKEPTAVDCKGTGDLGLCALAYLLSSSSATPVTTSIDALMHQTVAVRPEWVWVWTV